MTFSVIETMKAAYPVMPVLAVSDVADAIPLANALKKGGLTVLEVTLRTPAAMDVIKAMKTVEGLMVGAGTVTTVEQLEELQAIGADFAISPGATKTLLEAGQKLDIAFLPAIATVSEMMTAMEFGYSQFKFFPAEAIGGASALKSFSGPFPNVRFCPTGGISPENYQDYLKLPNVECVGGSWVVPKKALIEKDWDYITQLAEQACQKA